MTDKPTDPDRPDEELGPEPADDLGARLRKLTEGFGVRSASLHADLGPELRRLLHVPDWDSDSLRTLARVSWQLDRLIATQLVGEELQRVARISYNLGEPEVRDLKLLRRRNWLHQTQRRPSSSESQRDLREVVVPAFVASLRRQPPPRPSDDDIAEIMAAETGQPAGSYLPFPTAPAVASGPPAVEAPTADGTRVRTGRLILLVLMLVAATAVTVSLAAPGRQQGSTPTPTEALPTTPPLAAHTVTEIGGNRHGSPTFKDPFHPAETGQKVPFLQAVEVSCKVKSFSFDSIGPDGYWYRLASPPWNDGYYAPAITFLNGDPVDGPYDHNYDPAVPDC